VIPDTQALLVLGGTALAVIIISLNAFRIFARRPSNSPQAASSSPPPSGLSRIHSASVWASAIFVAVLGLSAFSIGGLINALVMMGMYGVSGLELAAFAFSVVTLAVSVLGACFLLYRLDLSRGRIKRRVKAFEVGWRGP